MSFLFIPIALYLSFSHFFVVVIVAVAQFHLLTQDIFGECFLSFGHNGIYEKSLPTRGFCFSGNERQIKDMLAENH